MNDELRIIVDLWHEKSTIITMFVTLIGYQILILFYLIYLSSVNIDFFSHIWETLPCSSLGCIIIIVNYFLKVIFWYIEFCHLS